MESISLDSIRKEWICVYSNIGAIEIASYVYTDLWRFGVKLQHNIRAVQGAPLSSSVLEEAL